LTNDHTINFIVLVTLGVATILNSCSINRLYDKMPTNPSHLCSIYNVGAARVVDCAALGRLFVSYPPRVSLVVRQWECPGECRLQWALAGEAEALTAVARAVGAADRDS